jgi:excisionase family DNA binding protein
LIELPKKGLLRVDEVAEFFSVNPVTVYRWISDGLITAEKYRKIIRVHRESVIAFRKNSIIDPEEKFAM